MIKGILLLILALFAFEFALRVIEQIKRNKQTLSMSDSLSRWLELARLSEKDIEPDEPDFMNQGRPYVTFEDEAEEQASNVENFFSFDVKNKV